MISWHVEMILMSTLLEGCMENTELHHKEWLKRNLGTVAKQRLSQITSQGGVKGDMQCCIWTWKIMALHHNMQLVLLEGAIKVNCIYS